MRVVALMLLLVAYPSSGVADERAVLRLRAWIDAVDAHAAGQSDAAFDLVATWTYDDLELVRPYVEALVLAPIDRNSDRAKRRRRLGRDAVDVLELTRALQARGDFDVFRKRAVMLHTDAGIRGPQPQLVRPPTEFELRMRRQSERRLIVKSLDGQIQHYELQNLHWELAMDVLDALPVTPALDPMVGQWYRAIGAYFARERRFADALLHFERARRVVPEHAGVLYGEACLQETLGAPRIQNYVRITTLPNGLFIRGVSSPATHYRRAEGLLRKALAADAALAEASLRLGRVLTELDRHEEALPYLRAAIAGTTDPGLNYYAHLFMGDAVHALGRREEARRQYENAIAIFPDSQAARLALGVVLRSEGDREAARAAIDPALNASPREQDDDPWWDYYDGDARDVERLLSELREPYARPR